MVYKQAKPGMNDGPTQWAQSLAGNAYLDRMSRLDVNLRVVYGDHYSKKAANFIKSIAPEIKDAKNWLFLIEGGTSTHGLKISEVGVAVGIAGENEIPVFDPIFAFPDKAVVEMYLKTEKGKGVSRMEVMGVISAAIAADTNILDTRRLANALGETEQYLEFAFSLLDARSRKDLKAYSAWSDEMLKDLVNISNMVSIQALDYYLKQNPACSDAVVYLGSAHKPMLFIVPEQIPQNLRISDINIRIEERDRKRDGRVT
jgi:hypothetical protein